MPNNLFRPRGRSRHLPRPDRRRALDLLASCRDGCTEAIMLAHGFSIDMMVEIINAGLASVARPSAWLPARTGWRSLHHRGGAADARGSR
jgi:hypothetical protein